jgi:PKD repeat protein
MKRLLTLAAALAFSGPLAAWAAPTVAITSPAPQGCLGAGRAPQPTQAGVDPPVLPSDVVVEADVGEGDGDPVTLVLRVGGLEVLREVHVPTLAGVPEAVSLRVPALAVVDAADQILELSAESTNGAAQDSVVTTIDRRPPRVVFRPADLAGAGACTVGQPPDLAFSVEDALDAAPTATSAWVAQGCQLRFEVTARDHCGAASNAALAVYTVRRAPPAAPTITFSGVAENEVTLRAVVDYTVTAGEGCVERVDATVQRDQNPPGGLIDGAILADPGTYAATVTVDPVCSEQLVSANRHFTVVAGARADAGGPYQTTQGVPVTLDASASVAPPQAGGIAGYDWDLDNDGFYDRVDAGPRVAFMRPQQGTYQVWVRIRLGNGERAFDDATVTVADPMPTCDAGGPYSVEQGALVAFDGSGTRAGAADEPVLSYAWDFGDARFPQQGDGLTQPTHRYADEGTYVVTLTARDLDSSCVDTAQVTVRDIQPVIRNLHVSPEVLVEGESVQASAGQTSAGSAAEPLVDFSWDWGDGTPPETGVELRGPAHTYVDSGRFAVCLTVRDLDSRASDCVDIDVQDLSPLAQFNGPGFALEGEPVDFDAAGSRAGGLLDPLSGLQWDFGDGTPVEARAPGETRITHVFTTAGALTVRLTVADEDSSVEVTRPIVVEDAEPLADLVVPPTGVEGVPVRLDASASIGGAASDPITRFTWDFGDGDTAEGPDLAATDHVFPDDGTYLVVVTVTDADGSVARRDAVIRITNAAPTQARIARADAGTPEVGRPVGLVVSWVDVPADPVGVTWSFGDGSPSATGTRVDHVFDAPGRYRVAAALDDGDGGTATAELFVQVERPGPEITGPTTATVAEGEPFTAQIDVRPAPDGAGGYDAPVNVRVPLLPPGATFQLVDVGNRPTIRRVVIRFTPGYAQEGPQRFHVEARSPTGLERGHDLVVDVQDVATPVLVGTQGGPGQGEVSVFAWHREPVTQVLAFERLGRTPLGEPPGDVVIEASGRRAFIALARSARVAVVDLTSGSVVRRIPIAPSGRAPALFAAGGGVWVAAGDNQLSRIDTERLKLGRPRALPASERLVRFEVVGDAVFGDLLAIGASGTSLHLFRLADVVGEAALRAPRTLALPYRIGAVAWDATGERLLLGEAKAARLHAVEGAGLLENRPVLNDRPFDLPGIAVEMVGGAEGEAAWISTPGGLLRLEADDLQVHGGRGTAGLAVLPSALLGEPCLALGSASVIEIQRVADQASVALWRGNGATRLRAALRR